MNDFQTGILTLIKSAVTGEKLALNPAFSLDGAGEFIRQQQIASLVYTGAVNCGLQLPPDLARSLFKQHCHCILYGEQQLQMCSAVFQAFDAAGIDYLPLKGCNMKPLYPKQELRWMSDADVLIRTGQYDRIRPIMLQLGFEEGVESDHEYIWDSSKLHIELHKRLIPSYNKDYYAYFGDGWRLAKPAAGCRYALSAEDAYIFQFVHFAKHYRDGGAGCRYVLDFWVFRRACPDLNEAYIRSELEKMQLLAFHKNMMDVVSAWFDGAVPGEKAGFITDFIFKGGSWGNYKDHLLSAEARITAQKEQARVSKLSMMRRLAFPGAKALSQRYGILKKCPYLLPLVWPVRWIDVILHRRGVLLQKQREFSFVNAQRVSDYQDALHYVGLDFNFDQNAIR